MLIINKKDLKIIFNPAGLMYSNNQATCFVKKKFYLIIGLAEIYTAIALTIMVNGNLLIRENS